MNSENIQGYRLSPQQRWLWLLHQEHPACRAQCGLALDGALDPAALRRAVDAAVARHDILRTTFHRAPGVKVPIQAVAEQGTAAWSATSLAPLGPAEQEAKLGELFRKEMSRPFDLERGPVLRATLIELGPRRHALFLSLPGVCADAWTLSLLAGEIAAGYVAADGGEEPVQYVQFSEWQHELLGEDGDRSARERWQRFDVSGYYGLRLPLEAAAGSAGASLRSFSPARTPVAWDAGVPARLEELARRREASVETLLLALWQSLFFRLTRREDLAVGAVLGGRKIEDLRGTLGPFAKAVPVRFPLSDGMDLPEILARAAEAHQAAADWQEYYVPEDLAAPEDAARNAPVLFELGEMPAPRTAAGVTFSVLDWYLCLERFKVKLSCLRRDAGLSAELHYDPRVLQPQAAERLAERFAALVRSLLDDPAAALGDVDLVSAAELEELTVAFNRTESAFPADRGFHHLVAEQAARVPGAVAVTARGQSLTYAELEAAAGRLAGRLRALGVGPEARVAVCLNRSPELLVGLLAVLKAGGAFVPLDPAHPRERLAWMLEDSQPRVLLTETALAGALPESPAERILLDAEPPALDPAGTPDGGAGPEDLAYVMYTSGSTGRPKGVMVPHRGLTNYLWWGRTAYSLEEGGAAPVHSPVGFDLTLTSLFAPLLVGGTVALLPEDQGVEALGEALSSPGGFALVKVTPAHLELLRRRLDDGGAAQGVRTLVVGGEALLGESLAAWRENAPEIRLVNEYGPTETVVGSCAYEVPPGSPPAGAVPIGRPIANTRIYLLDSRLRPVPFGVAGEIFIGGAGLARGYQRLPAVTAERFVPDPFSGRPGERLYRTGDLGRHLPDGNLEFMGRNDGQVKIRGFRIELGEIEAALARHPAVREAVVLAREDVPGDRRLVAYLVAVDGGPRSEELRRFLAEALPDPMVPSAFVLLPAMPLTPNGKVDRRALPAPGPERPDLEAAYVAPRTPVEEVLASLWAEVLGLDRVGVHDSFFSLGGDSIRSVRVVALAKERGLEFVIQDLFRHPTVAELAAHLGVDANLGAGVAEEEDPEELARMLAEIDGLSEEAVRAQLREKLQSPGGRE